MKLYVEYHRSNKVEEDAKSPSPTPNQENFLKFDESQIDSQVEFEYSYFIPQGFCWPGTVFMMHLWELGQNSINFLCENQAVARDSYQWRGLYVSGCIYHIFSIGICCTSSTKNTYFPQKLQFIVIILSKLHLLFLHRWWPMMKIILRDRESWKKCDNEALVCHCLAAVVCCPKLTNQQRLGMVIKSWAGCFKQQKQTSEGV